MITGGSNKRRDRMKQQRFKSQRGPLRLFTGGFKWYWAEFMFDRRLTRREQRRVPDILSAAGITEECMNVGEDRIFVWQAMDWGGPLELVDIEYAFRSLPPGWIRAAHFGATCENIECCVMRKQSRISYLSDGYCRPYYGCDGNVNPPLEVPEAPWFRLDYRATEPEPTTGPGKWDAGKRRR